VAVHPEHVDWSVERSSGEAPDRAVCLAGELRTANAAAIVAEVRRVTTGAGPVQIDLARVHDIDGGVIALLRSDLARRGLSATFREGERFQGLLDLYDDIPIPGPHRRWTFGGIHGVLTQVGRHTVADGVDLEQVFAFAGELTVSAGRLARHPSRGHWRAIPILVERAGADAVPIVVVINFLIGFVTAYMSAHALTMFGANIFVADLVGIATTRQLAPIMTAIVVCGRTGAAFATELGSMRVTEEIDALRTLGLQPFLWLVFPRVITLALVVPVLTLVGDVMGILGGLVVAVSSLGLTVQSYFNEVRGSLSAWDTESGLFMSVAIAVAIGLIACHQGLAASGGPQGVGRRTTSTVVISLFTIVLLDAVFTVFYRAAGLS
jgi:phospholipid/cholesterol/gamma-HCH transport system permease protein